MEAEKLQNGLAEEEKRLVDLLGPPGDKIKELYSTIPMPDGYGVSVKVFQPTKVPPGERPLVVLLHGGGLQAGSEEMCTRPGRELAEDFGAVVVSPSYRLCPQYKFPIPIQDGLDVVAWLAQHAEQKFGANPERGFVVGGFSAGGTIAAVVARKAIVQKLKHPITGLFLSIPQLFVESIVPTNYKNLWKSRVENDGKVPFLSHADTENYVKQLDIDATSPWYSPVNSSDGVAGFPRTYIQVGGNDVLRDDGFVFAKMLEDVKVEARIDSHEGIGHDAFTIWYNENSLPALKEDTMRGIAWLLRKE